MTTPRTIHPALVAGAFDVVQERTGRPLTFVYATYRKWQRGAMLAPCRYGKEKAIAHDCRCTGCIESLCYLYFDTVQNKVSPIGVTPLSRTFK